MINLKRKQSTPIHLLKGSPALVLVGLAMLVGCGSSSQNGTSPPITAQALATIDLKKELLITDLSVVNDPVRTVFPGPWSFGNLMKNIAGKQDVSAFILKWLSQWDTDQPINGFIAPARPNMRSVITNPWRQVSKCAPAPASCKLDFSKTPFRLLAIVNRMDLRVVPTNSGSFNNNGNAGEGRFVFGALDSGGNPLRFTMIFEFRLPANNVRDVEKWGKNWHALGTLGFGETFNSSLNTLTQKFSTNINNPPLRGVAKGLNSVRTHEVSLSPSNLDPSNIVNDSAQPLWELREFHLDSAGQLKQSTTNLTPDLISLNGTQRLADFINANTQAVLNGTHQLPENFSAASSLEPNDIIWSAPGVAPAVMKQFSGNTCSGCHRDSRVTDNKNFLHLNFRAFEEESTASAFMLEQALPYRTSDLQQLLSGNLEAPSPFRFKCDVPVGNVTC